MDEQPPAELRSRTDDRGRFINPWLEEGAERSMRDVLRWQVQRLREGVAPNPPAAAFPRVHPHPAVPRSAAEEARITWVGHATFLVQYAGLNLLTDPVWSPRASPFRWAGPERLAPPGVAFDDLPPIDAVLISHDHYDHLDARTVTRLHHQFGPGLRWITPRGYAAWFARRSVHGVVELDWWDEVSVRVGDDVVVIRALPAQHWTRRLTSPPRARLWAAYALGARGRLPVLFGGDSGYFAGYRDIGRLVGPFAAVVLPIGAYEPRWFMRAAHMNPEDAVQAYHDLGAAGAFVAGHWGTFRLTDEPPLDPPDRLRAAWAAAALPAQLLWIPRHGESRAFDITPARTP